MGAILLYHYLLAPACHEMVIDGSSCIIGAGDWQMHAHALLSSPFLILHVIDLPCMGSCT